MRTVLLGVLAVVSVATLARSKRLSAYVRDRVMRRRRENGIMDDDIQRFVNEGGTPVGAGAE